MCKKLHSQSKDSTSMKLQKSYFETISLNQIRTFALFMEGKFSQVVPSNVSAVLIPSSAIQAGLTLLRPSMVPPVITKWSSIETAQALCLLFLKGSSTLQC